MNRLTKEIGLVLISSSLVLYGCHKPQPMGETQRVCGPPGSDEDMQTTAQSTATSGYHSHSHGHVPIFLGGGRGRSGPGPSKTVGGSVRGGFGASAHGVSS